MTFSDMDTKQKIELQIDKCLSLKPRDEEHENVTTSLKNTLNDLKASLDKAPNSKKKLINKMIDKLEAEVKENDKQSLKILEEQRAKYKEELSNLRKVLCYSYIDSRKVEVKEYLKKRIKEVFELSESEFEIQLKQSLELKTSEESTITKSKDRKLKKFIKVDCDYAITCKGEKIPLTEKDSAMIINYPMVITSKACSAKESAPFGSRSTFGTASAL